MVAYGLSILCGLLSLAPAVLADVTIVTGAAPLDYAGAPPANSTDEFFRTTLQSEFYESSAEVLLSSYSNNPINGTEGITPSADSFIRSAINAWGGHQHLVLRPEEVWFTILVQMNFYMNSHAEEVRDLFVDFQGQKTITVQNFTWYEVIRQFSSEIQSRVKTDWLEAWAMPNFTTTTEDDKMTANILLMSLTQAYFKFEGGIICGLPSVTLLGERNDWVKLLAKLDHLKDFGSEPTSYAARLRPILTRFVASFDAPNSLSTLNFWNEIITAQTSNVCGAPPYYLSGWLTGFFHWDVKGRAYGQQGDKYTLDNVTYPRLGITTLPVGFAKAPFKMMDYPEQGQNFSAYVLAGTLGKQVTAGPPAGYVEAVKGLGNSSLAANVGDSRHGTIKPLSAWLLYGPVDYNRTVEDQGDPELRNLTSVLRSSFTVDSCGLPSVLGRPEEFGGFEGAL